VQRVSHQYQCDVVVRGQFRQARQILANVGACKVSSPWALRNKSSLPVKRNLLKAKWKPVPTTAHFAEHDFLPFVRSTSAAKPRTVVFCENSVRNLKAYEKLARLKLDAITSDVIAGFVAKRREAGMQVSTINWDLATLRRMFHLAQEWERVTMILPKSANDAGRKPTRAGPSKSSTGARVMK